LYNSLEFLKSNGSPAKRAKAGGQKGRGFGGGNFCLPAGFGWQVGVRLPKATAQVRIRRQDFVQNKFEFCPKDTAILRFWSFAL